MAASQLMALVFFCFALLLPSVCASEPSVLWQFTRDDAGTSLVNADLTAALGNPVIAANTRIFFSWNEGVMHSLYLTSSVTDFAQCTFTSGTRMVTRGTVVGTNVTINFTTPGTFYVLDDQGSNCALGMKMTVTVMGAGFVPSTTTIPTTTAPTTPPPLSQFANVVVVTWMLGATYTGISVTGDDLIRFVWNTSSTTHTLRQVTKAAFDSCSTTSGLVRAIVDSGTGVANVSVQQLSPGTAYFICTIPGHCAAGLRLAVTVAPARTRWNVTVWSLNNATGQAYVALVGVDTLTRVWVSPEGLLYDSSASAPLTTARPVTTSVFLRDVGTIRSVSLRSTDGWLASSVRFQRGDGSTASQTFTCSLSPDSPLEQLCVEAAALTTSTPTPSTNITRNATNTSDCSCYREVLVAPSAGRVFVCIPLGCFSTTDTATDAWADVPAIAHVVGGSIDGTVYGTTLAGAVVASADAGITWNPASLPVTLVAAQNYTFSVDNLTTVPLDADIRGSTDGTVLWGPTSQGVHYNKDGSWVLSALWACSCDGPCGLKCNQ